MAHPRHTAPADLPFPKGMPSDEREMRRQAYAGWLDGPAAFRASLGYLADWLGDRGRPDEAVCRSDWKPVRCGQPEPRGWWCWCVTPVEPIRWKVGDAGLRGRKHNANFWLCWPVGWVRFTGGYLVEKGYEPHWMGPNGLWVERTTGLEETEGSWQVAVPTAWCVCVQPHSTNYGTPIENAHGKAGWSALFHPPGALRSNGVAKVEAAPRPGLFDGCE